MCYVRVVGPMNYLSNAVSRLSLRCFFRSNGGPEPNLSEPARNMVKDHAVPVGTIAKRYSITTQAHTMLPSSGNTIS